uniref:Uncharacterized protein n=1 Tax=Arundo donax TaxID=35708 RepID=A0A0A9H642_ARUDO
MMVQVSITIFISEISVMPPSIEVQGS